ncbi:MAG: oxygen-independent coproporphyrinogen-3 oxidase [Marinoscillum sp.]|jgi:oxygen-independent coproporphyrinogen-3 oxidase
MVSAIGKELKMRKDEMDLGEVSSIYFGGGTPSLLSENQLMFLLTLIKEQFTLSENVEITLEANPDDLTEANLTAIKNSGINRLSVGIQTFDEERLKYINRAHSSKEAHDCLAIAQSLGFENISADLIYAIPPADIEYWKKDLEILLKYDLSHISLYGLTIEPNTVFGKWYEKGKLKETPEDIALDQYRYAIQTLTESGYEHYEVSNFAKAGKESHHNTSYWSGQKYLGLGPGAHSYDGNTRSYNISNNAKYIKDISEGRLPQTIESLTEANRINEYIFTRLRTKRGFLLEDFKKSFGLEFLVLSGEQLSEYVQNGLAINEKGNISLTSEGLMLADEITWRLFYEDEDLKK